MRIRNLFIGVVAVLIAVASLTACTSSGSKPSGQASAAAVANSRQNYVPKNDVEGKNYNARQKLADDPTTILWCTVYPTSPNAAAFTVPIVGKLTSSGKRPYATTQVQYQSDYSPEVAGPDGMFGTSVEYRYGFRPDGTYVDFTGLETYCATSPTIVQVQTTKIDLAVGDALSRANDAARAALGRGDKAGAQKILEQAMAAGAGK
jgi:hypothetical protein